MFNVRKHYFKEIKDLEEEIAKIKENCENYTEFAEEILSTFEEAFPDAKGHVLIETYGIWVLCKLDENTNFDISINLNDEIEDGLHVHNTIIFEMGRNEKKYTFNSESDIFDILEEIIEYVNKAA